MEADFQRFYGLDLRDELDTGVRRLAALVEGLPEDAATWRPDNEGWTRAHDLAAAQIEMTDLWGRISALVGGVKANKLPPPPQIRRPGTAGPRVEQDPEAIRRFFTKHLGKV